MIELLTEQSNNVQFNLEMEGGSEYDVYFTIVAEGVDYRLKATRGRDGTWVAAVPKSVSIATGEYAFNIDVVMDNHIYPAVQDTLVVKAPVRVTASVVEARATPTVVEPNVTFIGVTPPGRRARQTK